jgi:hypothetical protein
MARQKRATQEESGDTLETGWVKRLERLSTANETARRRRLASLTLESALREFEELCREVQDQYRGDFEHRPHPVGLVYYIMSAKDACE